MSKVSIRWRVLGLSAVLGASSALAAVPTGSAPYEAACASVPERTGPPVDLAALSERLAEVQATQTGTGLAEACAGWRQVSRSAASPTLLRTDWQAKIASALVWQGRSADAEPLLDAAYATYQAAGPGQSDNAGMVAAMLTFIWTQRGQLEVALQWSQRALASMRAPASTSSVRDQLRITLNHCALLSRARRFSEAQELLQQALDQALAQPQPLYAEAAAALNTLAVHARRQGRYEASLQFLDREVELRRTHVATDPWNIVNAMQNRGVVLISLARFDAAEAALNEALDRAQAARAAGAVDLQTHQAAVHETLSGLLLARGRPADALKAAQSAVQALAGRPEAKMVRGARPLRRVAEAQLALGELGQGVATYRQAIALLGTAVGAPEAEDAQAIRLGYAFAMMELGELEEAQTSLQTALADKRTRSAEETVRQKVLVATLAQRRGDLASAARAWQDADQSLSALLPPEHPDRRFVAMQACELQATPCPTLDDTGKPDTDALIQMSRGRLARARGDMAGAEAASRAALASALASGQPRVQWQALALWADVLADQAKLQQAIFIGKLALTQLQQQRQRLLPLGNVADARYVADKAPLYRRVADWLLQSQRIPEALEVMRLLKVQEQADFNERGFVDEAAAAGVALTPAEQAAWRRFEAAARATSAQADELRRLSERAAAQRITPDELESLARLRRDAAARRDADLASLGELRLVPPANGAGPRSDRPAPRAKRPPAGQLHAYTLAGEQRLSLLLVGAKGTELHQIDLPAAELARQVSGLRDALATRAGDVQPQAQALYGRVGRLIDAAARRHGASQIVVWLDGPLRYVPPGLMHDGRQPLAARYSWIVGGGLTPQRPAVSAAAPSPTRPRMAAFGVTRAFQGLPALAAVGDELCDIVDGPVLGLDDDARSSHCTDSARGRGPMQGQARLNALFTEADLVKASDGQSAEQLMHISTHFVLRPGSIAKSWLLLGNGSRLPLERMRELNLNAQRLVTLSACETAVVDAAGSDGREVDGLAATLLDRGAHQVLASLWRVDDRATARFMQRFYAAYASLHGQAAKALQQAQRTAIDEGLPERDWAAFVLLGQAAVR